jgi:Protein of unknown function (DUF3347)
MLKSVKTVDFVDLRCKLSINFAKNFPMKKLMYGFFLLAGLSACSSKDKEAEEKKKDEPQKPMEVSANSAAFNASFDALWNAYSSVKDALVKEDMTNADKFAQVLVTAADSLKLAEIKADPALIETAKGNAGNLAANAKGLIGEKDIEKKRASFEMVANDLFDLIRVVKYDRKKFYQQFCPMALGDKGAYWVSDARDIVNPFMGTHHPKYGNTMLDCGENKDSVDFAVKK